MIIKISILKNMKKYISKIKIISALFIILLLASCEKFLDVAPTDQVYHENLFSTTDLTQTVLDGSYRMLREQANNDQKSIDFRFDIIVGMDIMANQSSNFFGDYDLGVDKTTEDLGEVAALWSLYYKLINQTNLIITNIDNAEGTESDIAKIKGEAYGLRAYAYFYLVNIFQHAYIRGEDQAGVPIYTEPTTGETVGSARGTVKNVYDQIISDLLAAKENLENSSTRINKGYIDINVVKGLLSRTYLVMGKWQEAAQYAIDARTGYPLMTQTEYVGGFNDYTNQEWIWGLPFNSEEILGFDSFFSDYDLERSNSKWSVRINNKFVSYFSETDCRATYSVDGMYPLIVYKDQPPINMPITADVMDSLVTRKFRDVSSLTGNYVMMRSAEMYLIEAEAEAELGNYTKAQDALFEIQHRADTEATKSTATGQELIDEILLERRKELYGEGIVTLLDIKRRNLPVVREGNQMQGGYEAGSNRLVWQIPLHEIETNINISESDQNPL